MTQVTVDAGVFEDLAYQVAEDVRLDYSGRGMYGAECIGFTGDISTFIEFVKLLAEEIFNYNSEDETLQTLWDNLDNVRTDSMGYDTIFYWPRLTAESVDA